MSRLAELTKQSLGDLAQPLLDAGSIIPLGNNKRPVRGATWSKPIDPDYDWNFKGLGFRTGQSAGITVIDFDAEKNPDANVLTSRGSHIYVPYEYGDRTRQFHDIKTDIRGDGGYVEFWGHGKEILDLDLRSRSPYQNLLVPKSSIKRTTKKSYDCTTHATEYMMDAGDYRRKVFSAGYEFNLTVIRNRRVGQMENAGEGSRNLTLFRSACTFTALDIELESLTTAALDVGLDPAEIIATVESAKRNGMVFDYFSGAYTWLAIAKNEWDSPVADELAREAIEQHNMMPSFNQERIAEKIGMPLRTFKRHMKKYIDADILKRHTSKGRQPNGNLWPNNFELLLNKEERETE